MPTNVATIHVDLSLDDTTDLTSYAPSINVDHDLGSITYSELDNVTELYIDNLFAPFYYQVQNFFTTSATLSGSYYIHNNFDTNYISFTDVESITNVFTTSNAIYWANFLDVDFLIPNKFLNTVSYVFADIKLYIGTVSYNNNLDVACTLSNAFMYYSELDIYSTDGELLGGTRYDVDVSKGRLSFLLGDIYSSTLNQYYLEQDIFSAHNEALSVPHDVQIHNGNISVLSLDLFSSRIDISSYITSDIRLHSLEIVDFSLAPNKFKYFGDFLTVNIIDHLFEIDTARSTFTLNGNPIFTTFSDIANGKTAKCLIDNNFISDGVIELGVIAYNVVNDVRYAKFNLLFGYDVKAKFDFSLEFNKEISVRLCGTNDVICPNTSCDSFVFTTQDYPSYDLNASLSCVVSDDLQATIYPQSTAFMYGKEYILKISGVKDYSGNYMPAAEIVFIIEDSP